MVEGHASPPAGNRSYARLMIMTGLSFVAMFALMYSMVYAWDNVYANWNQFYMAALMTAAMVILEVLLMAGMYHNRRLNAAIIAAAFIGLFGSWFLIRRQAGISDNQFLRSMIPHHAGAILMCREASVRDPEIRDLCREIVTGQQAEIQQMKAILARNP